MIKCPECNKKYSVKDRYLMLKNINKEMICKNCDSKYLLNKTIIVILFVISMIGYIVLNGKLSNLLSGLKVSSIILDLLKIIICVPLMYGFIFLSSFLLKGKKVIKKL